MITKCTQNDYTESDQFNSFLYRFKNILNRNYSVNFLDLHAQNPPIHKHLLTHPHPPTQTHTSTCSLYSDGVFEPFYNRPRYNGALCSLSTKTNLGGDPGGSRGTKPPPLRVGDTVYSCPLKISKKLQKRSKHFLTRENSFHLFLTRSIQKWPVYLQLSNKIAASGGNNYRRPYKVYQRRLA